VSRVSHAALPLCKEAGLQLAVVRIMAGMTVASVPIYTRPAYVPPGERVKGSGRTVITVFRPERKDLSSVITTLGSLTNPSGSPMALDLRRGWH
jgi:hypothetical protein